MKRRQPENRLPQSATCPSYLRALYNFFSDQVEYTAILYGVSNCRYGSICGHSDPYQHGYGQEKSERTVKFTVLPTEQFEDK